MPNAMFEMNVNLIFSVYSFTVLNFISNPVEDTDILSNSLGVKGK